MANASEAEDRVFMAAALALARRSLGCAWPNPSVGCVLVKEGAVVGRGWTQPGGRPHAETEALRRAGAAAHGATAYVSLEPCAHWGVTPPCTGALLAAGVDRAVIAVEDPDPRVSGRGIGLLREGGVRVDVGMFAAEARDLNEGFFLRIGSGRPQVTLKTATTLDGRIATASGASRWITGPAARAVGHRLRAQNDAVMVGAGTVRADDPALTCRLPGLEDRRSVRVVVDGALGLDPASQLVQTARAHPTWVLTGPAAAAERRRRLEALGVEVIEVEADDRGRVALQPALLALGARGLTRVLVEGGGRLAAALFDADLVDRLAWFRAPVVVGGDGVPAAAPFGVQALPAAPRFQRVETRVLGPDVLELYRRAS